MRTSLKLTILSAVLVLAVSAVAFGATSGTYRGTTSQGLKGYVKVGATGVDLVNLPFVANDCNRGDGYSITARRFLYDAPFGGGSTHFSQKGTVSIATKGGKAVVTRTVKGAFSGKRVTGTQTLTLKAKDQFGRHTCKSKVTFSFKRAG
jgi:hypothetical protein